MPLARATPPHRVVSPRKSVVGLSNRALNLTRRCPAFKDGILNPAVQVSANCLPVPRSEATARGKRYRSPTTVTSGSSTRLARSSSTTTLQIPLK
jgi:hypothetical protein